MAVRRQVYVWNHRPDGFFGPQAARGGPRPPTTPASVFTGPYGTTTTVPAITSPTQFVVIEHISSSPGDSGPFAPAAPDPLAKPGNIPTQAVVPVNDGQIVPVNPQNLGTNGGLPPDELLRTAYPYVPGSLQVYVAFTLPAANPPYSLVPPGVPMKLGSVGTGVPAPGAEVVEISNPIPGGAYAGRRTGPNTALAPGFVSGTMLVGVGTVMGSPVSNNTYTLAYMASTAQVMSGGSTQMQINTTGYYQTPDGVQTPGGGVPGEASPYPASQMNQQFYFLSPNIYVLQGQTWDLLFNTRNAVGTNPQTSALATQVFCRYVLYDGPDSLIANKLLEMGMTVTPDNVDWYKKMLIDYANQIAQAQAQK